MSRVDPLTLSREELYELVWSKPMLELAKDFGLSDVALAKRCRRLAVPVPGRGYWARVAAGQAPRQAPLKKRNDEPSDYSALTFHAPDEDAPREQREVAPAAAKSEVRQKILALGIAEVIDRHGLKSWDAFLDDFVRHWPTHHDYTYVDFIRDGVRNSWPDWPGPGLRDGKPTELRLCERWTSSAKSVFQFDVQGSVAKSTHAGIPWLKVIREVVGEHIHVWPFDGWHLPESKCVLAEVYPSIFRNRYSREGRSADEQDAYAVCRWLSESAARNSLARYFDPPLTLSERQMALREGWILGIG